MPYVFQSAGANSAVFNANLIPALPPTYSVGSLLILPTTSYQGKLATPSIAGYSLLSPNVNAQQTAIYGRIATKTAADQPTYGWGNQWQIGRLLAYSGGPMSLTGIVAASIDRTANSTGAITYLALALAQAGCLVITYGSRDKTSTTNGATFAAPSSNFTLRTQSTTAGTAVNDVYSDWIQTTAANLAQVTQTPSALETATAQYQSIVLALLPAGTTPPPPPPTGRRSTLASLGAG